MRILSWNINGIRTLPQYHPWNMHKTGDAILAALEADIICFQEMKIQGTALEKHLAVPSRFDSFFSFPATKGGYSGVAVYTNMDTAAPLKAEEGLTGTLSSYSAGERISSSYPQAHEMELFADENEQTPSSLAPLDAEGRALVLDFGLFILVNVYCPAETSETRLPYKMNFHKMLEERVRILTHEEGREVIVVGDINVTADPIDHCDGHLPSHQANFWDHPPRAWLKRWLAPSGPMFDAIRDAWPDRKGMYTCWNTKISARESNYGTRVDYILLTRGLLPWIRHGDIQASVRGSDHCPIYIDLHDEIRLDSGKVLRLRDMMKHEEAKRDPPRISARFWKEFSGRQRLLSTFFAKKHANEADTENPVPSSSQGTLLLDFPSQEPAADVSSSPPDLIRSHTLGSTSSPQHSQSSANTQPERQFSRSQKKKPREIHLEEQPKKKKQKTGQTKLSTFFVKPTPITSSSCPGSSQSVQTPADGSPFADAEPVYMSDECSQIEADRNSARLLSETFETCVPRAPSSSQSKAAWTHLLAPLQAPRCKVHGEPCKEFTVNKPGPNKGKTFFVCSRPVGPGYDKGRSERLREEVDRQYRCDFFKWASEVKRESLKKYSKDLANGWLPGVRGNIDPANAEDEGC